MADQPARLREGLIIERQMEHGGREICAQRPADLDRAHRAAARRAAADVVHQFAKRNAEADLIKAAVLYRSEEHTSELQSLMRISYAVFCLKKKKHMKYRN